MNRKTVAKIMSDESLDDSAKVDQIFALYGASVGKLKSDDDVQKLIDEALTKAPKLKPTESEEYKTLQKEFDEFKYATEVKGALKTAKAKDKFLDDIIGKLDREKKVDDQLPDLKTKYGEFFDADENPDGKTPPPKPIFGSQLTNRQEPNEKKPIPKIF